MGKAIGIDLGTTNSVAAVEDGRARVLPTRMSESITPSVVSYRRPRGAGKIGEILVGRVAARNAPLAPEETVFSVKRLMGRTFDDPKIAETRHRYPYVIHRSDDGTEGIRIDLGGRPYSPEEISALILRHVIEDAEKALGAKVDEAVITVPAYFSESQRAATREAGLRAGIAVHKIIDEPTAAAIAFGIDRRAERHRVLVFDMGGGTFDISIIQMTGGQFQVMTIGGDNWLGGDDFDREIMDLMTAWILDKHGHDPSEDKRYLMVAKQEAERAKLALTAQREVELNTPGIVRLPTGQLIDLDMVLSREEFEQAIQPYVARSTDLVRKLLDEQHMTPDDITEVLMVGGSTAVPLVYDAVTSLFGESKVKRDLDPMQCVAMGAAVLAVRLPRDEAAPAGGPQGRVDGQVSIGEVTARNLGIQAVDQQGIKANVFVPIIHKGETYPLKRPKEEVFYTTGENRIRVPVYEGDDPVANRNELQGVIELSIPPDVGSNTPVSVQFNYDKDRILTVTVRVHGRDDLTKVTRLQRDRPRASMNPEDDRWREYVDSTISSLEHFLQQFQEFLERGQIAKARADLDKARRALAENNAVLGKQVGQALRMTLLGSGLATTFFLAERAMDGAEPSQAEALNAAMRELKDAHRRQDRARVEQVSSAVQFSVTRIFKERAESMGHSQVDYQGLLRQGRF